MIKNYTSSFERKIKSIIPNKFKIFFISILTNKMIGLLIKKLGLKSNFFGGIFDYNLVTDNEAAQIFWGIWESAEIRFSKRFVKTGTIIELGSSVGVTLGVLSNCHKGSKFICVEASTINFKKLIRLKKNLPAYNEYLLINKAISYTNDSIGFKHTSTMGSKIYYEPNYNVNTIPTITLANLLDENKINEEFTLITDIEGAEAEIFFKDKNALKNCIQIIAELEETSLYSISSQIKQLQSIGFVITEMYGNVIVMDRSAK